MLGLVKKDFSREKVAPIVFSDNTEYFILMIKSHTRKEFELVLKQFRT